jgi:hypothetical protein
MKFIKEFIDELCGDNNTEDIHIARVLNKNGNGRIDAFFVDSKTNPTIVQAVIRGSFSGKAKRSVWIDKNSIVIIADSGLSGSAEYSVMAVLGSEQIHEIRKHMKIDPRVLSLDITDTAQLMSTKPAQDEGGFEITLDDDELDISAI